MPANSCLLLESEDEAVRFPSGELRLGFCPGCGFISNTAFDASLAEYSGRYEETQAFSPRFVEFATSLASRWVDRHGLDGKTVFEIGCGKGEFLVMMAEAGIGRGIGIDPGVNPDRIDSPNAALLEWIPDFFTAAFGPIEADAVVCRHTLEHIQPVGDFLRLIRHAIGDRTDTVLLFELPDTKRVLDEVAFWDVYYEHCSYFSAGSLARLFERTGFEVLDISLAYDGQYLLLEARPVPAGSPARLWPVDDLADLSAGVDWFAVGFRDMTRRWTSRLEELRARGGTAVIWGAGSKGVAFLVETGGHVAAAVDVNPYKHGMFMAGTGHQIIAPEELKTLQPDLVVIMNPVYVHEIRSDIADLGLSPEVVAL